MNSTPSQRSRRPGRGGEQDAQGNRCDASGKGHIAYDPCLVKGNGGWSAAQQ